MAIFARRTRRTLILFSLLMLGGCSATSYYWQSVSGHLQLMQAAKPVDQWLADTQTSAQLRNQLVLAQRIRQFAVAELALPDNASYRQYADLQRRAVVWNVVAAPAFSLKLNTWCFPVLGCVGYRGYFSEAEARLEAEQLKAQGLEVSVYGVPAYSTLGWMNWAGGDPLLSTFIGYPEGELARTIFHELAHQVVYVPDDTGFNESFATAVERMGGARWLSAQSSGKAGSDYAAFDARRKQFRALTVVTRERLRRIYETPANAQETLTRAQRKADAMAEFREQYASLRLGWGGFPGYDPWVANANNASFGAQAAYDDLVPAFEAVFVREGSHWPAFYDAVRRLAALPKEERTRLLKQMADKTATSTGETHGG